MARFAFIVLVLFGIVASDAHLLGVACPPRPAALVSDLLDAAGNLMLPMLFSQFLSGWRVPRWTRWLLLPWPLAAAPLLLLPTPLDDVLTMHRWPGNLTAGLLLAICRVGQGYRDRRVSNATERQRTKRVVPSPVRARTQASCRRLLQWLPTPQRRVGAPRPRRLSDGVVSAPPACGRCGR